MLKQVSLQSFSHLYCCDICRITAQVKILQGQNSLVLNKKDCIMDIEKKIDNPKITIIGSGDFGRGLALRMVQCGFTVCIGSRNPKGGTK